MYTAFLVLVFVGCVLAVPRVLFNPTEVSQYGARCLDGTPSGYYLQKTTNPQNLNKWVFFLEGGGWCFPNSPYPNVENCFGRINNGLGSSNFWPADQGVGFFRDYNVVFIKYCGGDFHSGTRTTAVNGLYYAGHNTIRAVIGKLKAEDTLSSATLVILSGSSAGGIGAIVNFDYVQGQFPSASFKLWPLAGWFPEQVPPYTSDRISMAASYQTLYSQVNAHLNPTCVAAHPSDPWLCYSGQIVYPHIGSTPLLVTQALFDNWAQGFNGIPGSNSAGGIKYMSHYGQAMRNGLSSALTAGNSIGLFITSEDLHEIGTGVVVNGVSLATIAGNWIDGLGNVKAVSNCTYLNCANIPYKGCYNDQSVRDLPSPGPQVGTQTIEACQTYCRNNGFLFAGVQFGIECYCGNSFGRFGPDLSGCNINCAGDTNEFCGSAWHNDVFSV